MKKALYIILLAVIAPAFAYSQKAYEAIKYHGIVNNVSLSFTLANGYLAGCKIITTDNKTHKTSQFLPENGYVEDDKTLKFYHRSASGKTFTDYFIMQGMEELLEDVPAKLQGTYHANGKTYRFVVKQ
jgi:hypothetical protein